MIFRLRSFWTRTRWVLNFLNFDVLWCLVNLFLVLVFFLWWNCCGASPLAPPSWARQDGDVTLEEFHWGAWEPQGGWQLTSRKKLGELRMVRRFFWSCSERAKHFIRSNYKFMKISFSLIFLQDLPPRSWFHWKSSSWKSSSKIETVAPVLCMETLRKRLLPGPHEIYEIYETDWDGLRRIETDWDGVRVSFLFQKRQEISRNLKKSQISWNSGMVLCAVSTWPKNITGLVFDRSTLVGEHWNW